MISPSLFSRPLQLALSQIKPDRVLKQFTPQLTPSRWYGPDCIIWFPLASTIPQHYPRVFDLQTSLNVLMWHLKTRSVKAMVQWLHYSLCYYLLFQTLSTAQIYIKKLLSCCHKQHHVGPRGNSEPSAVQRQPMPYGLKSRATWTTLHHLIYRLGITRRNGYILQDRWMSSSVFPKFMPWELSAWKMRQKAWKWSKVWIQSALKKWGRRSG